VIPCANIIPISWNLKAKVASPRRSVVIETRRFPIRAELLFFEALKNALTPPIPD